MSERRYSLGLDFGTGSARALLVDIADGREVATGVSPFRHGEGGVIGDSREPLVARQHPGDWLEATEDAVRQALALARATDASFVPASVLGIGIDATASTPLLVDDGCRPLALDPAFAADPGALAWLWKDHAAIAEAEEITRAAREHRPQYLAKCGGSYSSEWLFSKLLCCLRRHPRVAAAAQGFIEEGDFIAATLAGIAAPRQAPRNACAAGHKGLHHPAWGGWPDADFLRQVDASLAAWWAERPPGPVQAADRAAGSLCAAWAARLGMPAGTPIATALIDAHAGAVGAGVRPGVLVKILGTSACDLLVHPGGRPLADIPGIAGVAVDSILPGHLGLEAGQAAVGDLFAWCARELGGGASQEELTIAAAALPPGATGLLALDWHNGNRSVLADQRLTGAIFGLTLATPPAAIYRALVEATGFGARTILERFAEHRVPVEELVVCGGIALRSPFILQTYADITRRQLKVSRAAETCALGAAICGAVVGGGWSSVEAAQRAMTGTEARTYSPRPGTSAAYEELHALYRLLHDAFSAHGGPQILSGVMKRLIALRDRARA